MSHPITFRFLQPTDAASFQTLRLKGLRESPDAFGSTYENECARPLETIAQRITLNSDGAGVLGAFADNGTLAGIVGFARELGPKTRHKAFLWGMYVDPVFRRHGVGRALLTRVIDHARTLPELRAINLAVTTVKPEAEALYACLGFQVYGIESEAQSSAGGFIDEKLMRLALRKLT